MIIKKVFTLFIFISIISVLTACQTEENNEKVVSKKQTAAEVLALEKDADIFQLNGTVYKTNIDWVNKLTLTKKKKVGTIKNTANSSFKDGTASILQKGTVIFSVNERDDILIAEVDGQIKKYYALTEG
ncbi:MULTISPECIES: hypothetical protein [Bacillus]|uniref:hypothetical protein n=1 Tax=Bacillus TaxID=1386 RepID=UPI0028617D4F|nr:hypothetical protein [Bacillus pumilus]MDR6748549.1 putative membrane protein [Bacillus pumilus]MDR7250259.1 putative membrane protein [Bacillus pumilus]